MNHVIRRPLMPLLLTVLTWVAPAAASEVTLEELFKDFQKCDFKGFFYSPWDPTQAVHPYLLERALTPYKESNGLYYFKVKDSLFGLPVSEIIIPGTWDLHAVVFDVPVARARDVMKRRFGNTFSPSELSTAGKVPVLEPVEGETGRSVLYCNENW
jgi:hypothetical protein